MLVFLALNGIVLEYTQKELWTIILEIASGKKMQEDLLEWIKTHQLLTVCFDIFHFTCYNYVNVIT